MAANVRSFNNEQGLPVTVLGAPDDVDVLLLEMGMRGPGEITRLCAVAQPEIGVVTAVAAAHTELLGGIDAVARAKAELVDALPSTGVAVLNADDARVTAMAERTAARVLRFGRHAEADVRIGDLTTDELAPTELHRRDAVGRVVEWQSVRGQPLIDHATAHRFVVEPERQELIRRIDGRFDRMIERGAQDEVQQLLRLELDPALPAMKAIGVRELASAYRAEMTNEEAMLRAKVATRQYAKRQMTWFRNQFGEEWNQNPRRRHDCRRRFRARAGVGLARCCRFVDQRLKSLVFSPRYAGTSMVLRLPGAYQAGPSDPVATAQLEYRTRRATFPVDRTAAESLLSATMKTTLILVVGRRMGKAV